MSILCILLTSALAHAALTSDAPAHELADHELAAAYFAEAARLTSADGAQLWGRSLAAPLLFVDRQTRSVCANQADKADRLKPSKVAGVFTGQLTDDVNPANTALEWSGVRWTMVLWPLPENGYERRRLLAHELFHHAQPGLGLALANPDNPHLDTAPGRIWLRLEMRALVVALLEQGKPSKQAIDDALVFRRHRRALIKDSAESERALELNEGLAEYTGLMLCRVPGRWLPDRAALRLERTETEEAFQRSFPYATGPAWAILNDLYAGSWRKRLTATDDLADVLAKALGVAAPTDLAARAEARVAAYDGARLIEQETRRDAERREHHRVLRRRFVDGPVLLLPGSVNTQYNFDPNEIESLPDVGQVFNTTRVTDAWGVLEVTAGGAVQLPDGAGWRVPAPNRTGQNIVTGDGWTLKLNPGWSVVDGQRKGDLAVQPTSGK